MGRPKATPETTACETPGCGHTRTSHWRDHGRGCLLMYCSCTAYTPPSKVKKEVDSG